MKRFILAALVAAVALIAVPCYSQDTGTLADTTSTVRAHATVTTGGDNSTFAVTARDVAYNLYVWTTLGSSTGITVTPLVSVDGTTATTSLLPVTANSKSITASGGNAYRLLKQDVNGYRYAGVNVKSTSGTATSVIVQMRRERF